MDKRAGAVTIPVELFEWSDELSQSRWLIGVAARLYIT